VRTPRDAAPTTAVHAPFFSAVLQNQILLTRVGETRSVRPAGPRRLGPWRTKRSTIS
jgi:hypothetical protein